MQSFDAAFIAEVTKRLGGIHRDTKPIWGRMRAPQMLAHLTTAVRYSNGKENESPNEGGFFGRWIAGPLILNGIIKIPRNQEAPNMYASQAPEGDIETLAGELREFLSHLESGNYRAPAHPYFGDFGNSGWARLHVVHFDHHARQFGA